MAQSIHKSDVRTGGMCPPPLLKVGGGIVWFVPHHFLRTKLCCINITYTQVECKYGVSQSTSQKKAILLPQLSVVSSGITA